MKTGTLGMTVFLVSLAALFAATMIGYIIVMIRLSGEQVVHDPFAEGTGERTVEAISLPPLPTVLWASTAVIIISSFTLQWAKNGIRAGSQAVLRAGVIMTLLLGLAFLVMQAIAWFDWYDRAAGLADDRFYRFAMTSFFVLSGVHAAHVIGGLAPMMVVAARAMRGRYTKENYPGVAHLTLYWHFLDIIWLIMFALLWILT